MASDGASPANGNVDTWFKYRMVYLLAAVVTFTLKLLCYPGIETGQFDAASSTGTLELYLQYRASSVILISAIYGYSYLKDWYFERVALAILGVSVTALFVDYFNAYVHLSPAPSDWFALVIVLRFLAIFCLLLNAMNARYAPPMPRRLWS